MFEDYDRTMKIFIPAFRLKAARMMVNEYGVKQAEAAKLLGTTQAAISKYLNDNSDRFKNIKINQKSLRMFVESIKTGDEKKAHAILCGMCQSNKQFGCAFMVK